MIERLGNQAVGGNNLCFILRRMHRRGVFLRIERPLCFQDLLEFLIGLCHRDGSNPGHTISSLFGATRHALPFFEGPQKITLSANWIRRGGAALLIWPKLGELISLTGRPKFGRFRKLKHSARNCTMRDSLNAKFLKSEKSHCASPGPWTIFRPALPKLPDCVTR